MEEAPLRVVPVYLRGDQLRTLISALRGYLERLNRERDAEPEKYRGAGMVARVLDEQAEISRMLIMVLEGKLAEVTVRREA